MQKIKSLLFKQPGSYNNIMLWAACCPALFSFLRVSDFTVPNYESYDESSHLSLKDLSIDSHVNPCLIKLTIKQSKTDPFRKDINIYLGTTDSSTCPVSGILPYLAARGNWEGPVFLTEKGKGLTLQMFSNRIDADLERLQIDLCQYDTHSFCIGAATTAAQAHIPEVHIKMLGRWHSDTYQRYIKTPPQQLAQLSRHLASAAAMITPPDRTCSLLH